MGSDWDPEEYRKSLTTEKIVEALACYLPTRPDVPKLPVAVCVEEAIKLLSSVERLEAALWEIAGATKYKSHPLGHEDMVSDRVVDIAKEALEETK